jgi:putative FmdB family regulatory protein
MPIYEYRCADCGHQDEYLQKVSEPPNSVCPACGKPTFQKLLSAVGFHLKGSGWYATDFKHSGEKPADKKVEKKPEAKTESVKTEPAKTDSTKSESAPASGRGARAACTTD